MPTPVTQIEYPPLDSQATYTFIDSQLTAAQKTGSLADDFKLALATVLSLDPNKYAVDDLWRRYLTTVVSGDANAKSGNPAAGGRKGGQHMGHYYSQSHRKNTGNANSYPGGGFNMPKSANLTCHLDAGNSDSYAGTGATWADISANSFDATWLKGATDCEATYVSATDASHFDMDLSTATLDRVFEIADNAAFRPDGGGEFTLALLTAPSNVSTVSQDYALSKSNAFAMLYNYYNAGRYSMFINAAGTWNDTFNDYTSATIDEWYLHILVRDEAGATDGLQGYINGNANTDRSITANVNSTVGTSWRIGGSGTAASLLFPGKVAMFAFWDTALTPAEVATLTSHYDSRYTLSTSYV